MFNPGGQIDHLTFSGVFGGGGKGGGGSAPQVAPTYTDPVNGKTFTDQGVPGLSGMTGGISGADALNAEITQRQADELAKSNADKATADAKTAGDESTFQGKLKAATDQGWLNVGQYFRDQGLDPAQYNSKIANYINSAAASVPDLSPNPMSAFPNTLGATILNQLTSGQQAQASSAVSKQFGPTYTQDNLPLTSYGSAVNDILASQFDPLSAQLQNAQKRGTLNDVGYAAALKAMDDKRTAATSTLNSLGSGIINNDRSALSSYISGAKNDAANVSLNDAASFDPTKYTGEAQSMIADDLGKLPGDLRNAVGSTSFADLPSLLNAGGSVQGANDPTATNPNGAIGPNGAPIGGGGVSPSFIADQVLANTKRGLGTQGAF